MDSLSSKPNTDDRVAELPSVTVPMGGWIWSGQVGYLCQYAGKGRSNWKINFIFMHVNVAPLMPSTLYFIHAMKLSYF